MSNSEHGTFLFYYIMILKILMLDSRSLKFSLIITNHVLQLLLICYNFQYNMTIFISFCCAKYKTLKLLEVSCF